MTTWIGRMLCALRGHGGITDIVYYSNHTAEGRCKKCGARVEL